MSGEKITDLVVRLMDDLKMPLKCSMVEAQMADLKKT